MRSVYIKEAVAYARQLLAWKVPYLWAGNDEYVGVDCSGMVVAIFRRIGLISRKADLSSKGMYEKWSKYRTDTPTPGCLVFYGKDLKNISHVAMMITTRHIIEAGGGGRDCTSIKISNAKGARVRLNPYTYRKHLAIVDPFRDIPR